MRGPKVTFEVDNDVPIAQLFRAFATAGLRVSNIPGCDFTLRIHLPPPEAQVIDLAARRDARTDAEIRAGMKILFGPTTEQP